MILLFPLQLSLAALLAAFLSTERCMAGGRNDWRVHAWAGAAGGAFGLIAILLTRAHTFDFMLVAGLLAVSIGALCRASAEEMIARGKNDAHAKVDIVSFTGALYVGAACGFGTISGAIFVVLIFALVSIFREHEKVTEGVQAVPHTRLEAISNAQQALTVSVAEQNIVFNPARDGLAEGFVVTIPRAAVQQDADVGLSAKAVQTGAPAADNILAQTGSAAALAEAAIQLAALAASLRDTITERARASDVFDHLTRAETQPSYARVRVRRPYHNVAVRGIVQAASPPRRRTPSAGMLQRPNFRPIK